jgi:hypothetical protein
MRLLHLLPFTFARRPWWTLDSIVRSKAVLRRAHRPAVRRFKLDKLPVFEFDYSWYGIFKELEPLELFNGYLKTHFEEV